MARRKEYIESEVIEKAMEVFWRNGYETTSVRMLEKAMGINQFSMYSSFGSKKGVFLESIKCYQDKTKGIFTELKNSTKGVGGIKEFFYNSLKFASECNSPKGCLITNTFHEFAESDEKVIGELLTNFAAGLKEIFKEKLRESGYTDEEQLRKQANYLFIAKQGLSVAAKVATQDELDDYIEMTFRNF